MSFDNFMYMPVPFIAIIKQQGVNALKHLSLVALHQDENISARCNDVI